MPRRTKAAAEQTRLAIIEAARYAFYERGVHGTRLDDIASAAGVTRGAIYWHFKNKTELFYAMRDQAALPLIDGVDEAQLFADAGDPLGCIERALMTLLQQLDRDPVLKRTHQIMAFRCEYVGELAPAFERIYLAPEPAFRTLLQRAYTQAARADQLRPGLSPGQAATDTAAFVSGVITQWLARDGSTTATRAARRGIRDHIQLRRPDRDMQINDAAP